MTITLAAERTYKLQGTLNHYSVPINTDQNCAIDPKYGSTKINGDQCPSILLMFNRTPRVLGGTEIIAI